jgi:hypothetical protein
LLSLFGPLSPFVTDSLETGNLFQKIDEIAVVVLLVGRHTQVTATQGRDCLTEAQDSVLAEPSISAITGFHILAGKSW